MNGNKQGRGSSVKKTNIDSNQAILDRLQELERTQKESEKEKEQLKLELASIKEKSTQYEVDASIVTAKMSASPESVTPYPTGVKRPKYIILKEKEFEKYGVGVQSITFEYVNNPEDNKSIRMIKCRDKVIYSGEVVNMVYAKNHESPFIIDHPKDQDWVPETSMILFSEGKLTVPPSDPGLQRFLLSHSKYGNVWKVYDQDEINRIFNEKHEKIIEATSFVLKLTRSSDAHKIRYFAAYALSPIDAELCSLETLKSELIKKVTEDPSLVKSYSGKEDEFKIKYIGQLACSSGFVRYKVDTIYTGEGRKLCSTEGKDFHQAFYDYCKEYPAVLTNIREKVGIE